MSERKRIIGIVMLGLAAVWLIAAIGCKPRVDTDQTPPEFSGVEGAVVVSDTTISLSWSAASDDESVADQIVYPVYYSSVSGGQDFGSPDVTAPAGVTTYEVDGLWPKMTYYFVVRAEDEAGNRDENTVEVNATTPSQAYTIQQNPSTSDQESALCIAADADYVYVGGQDGTPGNVEWRIEKRDKATGALETAFDGDGAVVSSPSSSVDALTCIAVDADYVYAAGWDYSPSSNTQWRIEKRDKVTGALETDFDTDGVVVSNPTGAADYLNSIVIYDSYLYVAGSAGANWRIEKRDKSTGALVTAFDTDGVAEVIYGGGTNPATSIAADASYLYVAGYDYVPGNDQWRIEKRDKVTGALISAFDSDGVVESNPSTNHDRLWFITVDASYLYVTGYESVSGTSQLRIEKRDKVTGALASGFDGDGVVQAAITNGSNARSIAVDASYLYVAAEDYSLGASNSQWRIEKRNKNTGALVSAFDTDGVVESNPSSYGDSAKAMIADASYLYVAGDDHSTGSSNQGWRIEKRILHSGGF